MNFNSTALVVKMLFRVQKSPPPELGLREEDLADLLKIRQFPLKLLPAKNKYFTDPPKLIPAKFEFVLNRQN